MRIISGVNKGRNLVDLGKGDPLAHLRPTSDRVRESIFNLIIGGRFGNKLENCYILDMFAGTGALGLEALSRGAKSVLFVDNGQRAIQLLRKISLFAVWKIKLLLLKPMPQKSFQYRKKIALI